MARVVLIDLSSLFHPAWRAGENFPLSQAFQATIDAVTKCAKKDPNALVAICLDSRKSWRKELAPSYKAQREKLGNDFYATLDAVKERLRADGYLLWESEGFEADDVIATACEEAVKRGHDVVICSADKDLMQLLRPGVRQFRTHDQTMWTETEAEAKFGIKCSQLGDYLALVGDPSDNIKGCQGVGDKRAAAMLQANGDWAGIVKAMEGSQFTPAITAALQGFDYATTRKLIDLVKDVPIAFDELYQRRELKPLTSFRDEPMNDSDLEARNGVADTAKKNRASSTSSEERDQSREQETAPTGARETPVRDEGAAATGQPTSGPSQGLPENQSAALGELPPDIKIGQLVPFEAKERRPTVIVSAQFDRQLEPRDLQEAFWLAQGLYESRVYTKWGSPHAMWLAIIRGREMGFPSAVALDLFHPMEGGLALKSNTIHALAEKLPECEYIDCIETTATSATWETKHRRRPEPRRYTYTREMAVQAGLCGPEPAPPPPKGQRDQRSNWDKRCQNMVSKTARDNLLRMVYPSAASLYTVTELGGDDGEN